LFTNGKITKEVFVHRRKNCRFREEIWPKGFLFTNGKITLIERKIALIKRNSSSRGYRN